jgi:hypothetical protein
MAKFDELQKARWDPLFDEEKEEYGEDFMTSLAELMCHYVDHWKEWDSRWTILGVEQDYEMMTKHGWPVRWKADLLVSESVRTSNIRRIKGHDQTRVILVEHKFKKKIPTAEERILQPQVHAYAWLLGKKGIKVDSILWDYIRTEPVTRPQINLNGSLSVRKISTDQRGYLRSLREANKYPTTGEGIKELEEYLKTLPETLSLERITNSVNLRMGEQFVRDWVERAKRAEGFARPIRSWGRNCRFSCDYYKLCQVDMRGDTDRNLVILKDYETKPDRIKEEVK